MVNEVAKLLYLQPLPLPPQPLLPPPLPVSITKLASHFALHN